MAYAVVDVESTTFQKGNPFSYQNKLCLIGIRIDALDTIIQVEYDSVTPYSEGLSEAQRLIDSVDTVVLFNGKFDLNWLRRYGIGLRDHHRVFDCQLAEFILNCQRPAYPSLDDCLSKRGLGSKSTVVADLWARGIDTPDIPLDILIPYLKDDLRLTDELYRQILKDLETDSRKTLIGLANQDLRVLQEMEFNGLRFSWDSIANAQTKAEQELGEIDATLRQQWIPPEAHDIFNPDSGDHLSVLLYGGVLRGKRPTPYKRVYKTGARAGQTVDANRWEAYEYHFERLVKPPKNSELKKDGFYSTDEETLLSLSKPRALVKLILRRAELAKLSQTYFAGIPAIAVKYDWQDGYIHGTFNQCRVITGRLASEKPNLQNFPEVMNQYMISRFV